MQFRKVWEKGSTLMKNSIVYANEIGSSESSVTQVKDLPPDMAVTQFPPRYPELGGGCILSEQVAEKVVTNQWGGRKDTHQ